MKKSISLILILFVAIILYSCHKEGLGGEGVITVEVRYLTVQQVQMPVYIKYGSTSSPGHNLRDYDDAKTTNSKGKVEFKYLYRGDYYVYSGCPKPICDDTLFLRKGVPVNLKSNTSVQNIVIDLDSLN